MYIVNFKDPTNFEKCICILHAFLSNSLICDSIAVMCRHASKKCLNEGF